jgi:raffinose/stachyose/melibiose transport system substrate-binding protein
MKRALMVWCIIALVLPVFATGNVEQATTVKSESSISSNEIAQVGGGPFSAKVKITFMNSKPEITEALQAGCKVFGDAYNVEIELYETSSPGDTLAKKYAAGEAPTVAIVDLANVRDLYAEKLVDLSNETWVPLGGKELGAVMKDKVYGMPFTIEGTGLLYNKTAIEKIIGKTFVPTEYATLDAFKALCAELQKGGMKYPVVLNSEDWSVNKTYQWIYAYQDGTINGAIQFLKAVHDGKTTFEDNAIFQGVMDTYNYFTSININQADPLAADYDLNASYVAEGEAAFWLNGTWAWPDFAPFAVAGMEYGICAYPINGAPAIQGKAFGAATKFIMIDKVNSSEDQKKAAKMLLNWLVFTKQGQDCLVSQCEVVPAFSNITLEPTNPFNVSLKKLINEGLLAEGVTYAPSDHRSVLAAPLQAYLAGKNTTMDIAKLLDEYWTKRLPKE